MEIEAKAILTSEKQLEEIKEVLKSKFKLSQGEEYKSSDSYWKVNDHLMRIRELESYSYGMRSLRSTRYFITTKQKTRKNGGEINKEYEQGISSDLLLQFIYPLLIETSKKAIYVKTKSYTQFGYLEPAEKRFYKIDCGYAWNNIGNKIPYVEIETLVGKDSIGVYVIDDSTETTNSLQVILGVFKTLGIDNLVTDKSWTEILGN